MLILIISVLSCKKPYLPPAVSSSKNYLVVEGVINSGTDSTIIKLSRTVHLSSGTTINPETNAVLIVESDQNIIYPLTEATDGFYATAGLNLDITRKYRLRIKTVGNQQYLSDFVQVKTTPPIDSVGFIIEKNGLQIYANAHDIQNNTRYYRWDYVETWQFHSEFQSNLISDGQEIVQRTPAQMIYNCFGNNTASSIVLGSSAKLRQDEIFQNPITTIASTSEKIETKYSILLRQYALTGDAFTFWQNLKTSTEQLGSIFDAQPSNIKANIHNVNNTAEPVIGYVSACTVQTKRIFISNTQLPKSWEAVYPYNCTQDSVSSAGDITNLTHLPSFTIPTNPYFHGSAFAGYLSSSVECVDCTVRGVTKQPAFWK
jgi:hypothetical protein